MDLSDSLDRLKEREPQPIESFHRPHAQIAKHETSLRCRAVFRLRVESRPDDRWADQSI
jgi:hypothetical protein